METAVAKVPLSERINSRLLVFSGVMLLLIGYPAYVYLNSALSGGVREVGEYKLVDLKAMSTFLFDQRNGTLQDIPEKWRALDGQKVILEGEIWQPQDAGNGRMTAFELCYSIANCCYTGEPQVQHFVQSTVPPNVWAQYFNGLVRVYGTLHVDVKRGPEKVESVYQLDVEKVEPIF